MSRLRADLFVGAQELMLETAFHELRHQKKETHWVWFVFPQLASLGRSPRAKLFGLAGGLQAVEYLEHPELRTNLIRATVLLTPMSPTRLLAALGRVDHRKVCSSLTLFEAAGIGHASGSPMFGAVLDRQYRGVRCHETLSRLIAR